MITGHTGFKGAWLSMWLHGMGTQVHGFALDPVTEPNIFDVARVGSLLTSDTRGDIRDENLISAVFQRVQPEVVFHLAAQPLVSYSYDHPVETYAVNVMGTANVLESARFSQALRAIVIVTTDKCYENVEWIHPYRENDRLGGFDPYSSSKACAELLVAAYRTSYFNTESKPHPISLATARAGNVIGGGDWADNRLIPDCIRSFIAGEALELRYPQAVRPWQHVLEPLSGYLLLAQALLGDNHASFSEAWNFGPDIADSTTVGDVAKLAASLWGTEVNISSVDPINHEANLLRLDSTKARVFLGWQPKWHITMALESTIAWYRAWADGDDMQAFSLGQIATYMRKGN